MTNDYFRCWFDNSLSKDLVFFFKVCKNFNVVLMFAKFQLVILSMLCVG